jgi:5-methylcytosine-specific restriction enzyme A
MPLTPLMHRPLGQLKPRLKVHSVASSTAHLRLTGRALQRRNARILKLYPMCALCEQKGLVSASTQVDHRLPLIDGGTDHETNLWGICEDCHKAKTSAEARRRAQGLSGDVLPGLPAIKPKPAPVVA